MTAAVRPQTKPVSVSLGEIELTTAPFEFRIRRPWRPRRSRPSRSSPILEALPAGHRILDGHRRLRQAFAERRSHALCRVFPAAELLTADRYRIIVAANQDSGGPYGLFERARLVRYFSRAGLSATMMRDVLPAGRHEADDLIDIADAPPLLARLLDRTPIEPLFAAMLVRRYRGWLKTPDARHANFVARRLLRYAATESLTMKSWRFYLDFYWRSERPSLLPGWRK